ncbi:TetR/AcrR family transcriptional regulator C-terminal domain-containing protein [Rhodococcus sp. NPDC003322]
MGRRERPAKPALTREGIVHAAMDIVRDSEGPKLTLRLLAQRLDTGPASLYVYIRNITELNALLLDEVLADLDVSWEPPESWRERIHRLLGEYASLLTQFPELAKSAMLVWPDGPHYLDLVELLMQLLHAAGVEDEVAARSVDLLLQHATALAAERGGRAQDSGQNLDDLKATLTAADPSRHPNLVRVGVDVFFRDEPSERNRWIVDVLLDGILAVDDR